MKHKTFIAKILIVSLFITSVSPCFAEDNTPEPYENEQFPQLFKDIRRFEIITLGALPFMTLNTTLAYSGIQYVQHDFDSAYTPNPFAASAYDTDEQKTILLTALGICVGIGLTDYIIQVIKRSKKKRQNKLMQEDIFITPVVEETLPDTVIVDETVPVEEVEE